MKEFDKSNMFEVLINFHKQISEAVDIAYNVDLTGFNVDNINTIIINGLGGSAIGGDLVRSYSHYTSRLPIYINRNYNLPGFAGKNTLSVISSYSGNTEETNNAYSESIKKDCKILCITSGGKVQNMAEKINNLLIIIPGGLQPRCAIGYSFFSLLITLSRLKFFEISKTEIDNIISNIKDLSILYSGFNESNPARKIAEQLKNSLPVIYSSTDILDVVNLRWRGQISENAKQLAYGNVYPEMNHNELVGWEMNENLLGQITVIFLQDMDDNERIKTRMDITSDIYRKYARDIIVVSDNATSRFERVLNLIYLGDWDSYHLALLIKVDTTPVVAIIYLKEKLS